MLSIITILLLKVLASAFFTEIIYRALKKLHGGEFDYVIFLLCVLGAFEMLFFSEGLKKIFSVESLPHEAVILTGAFAVLGVLQIVRFVIWYKTGRDIRDDRRG